MEFLAVAMAVCSAINVAYILYTLLKWFITSKIGKRISRSIYVSIEQPPSESNVIEFPYSTIGEHNKAHLRLRVRVSSWWERTKSYASRVSAWASSW
jgi:hypothetical protein